MSAVTETITPLCCSPRSSVNYDYVVRSCEISEQPQLPSLDLSTNEHGVHQPLRLRKRPVEDYDCSITQQLNLPSYNSAFLSGLFADLASSAAPAAEPSDTLFGAERDRETPSSSPSTVPIVRTELSIKRRRVSTDMSMNCSGPSRKNLSMFFSIVESNNSTFSKDNGKREDLEKKSMTPQLDLLPTSVSDSFSSQRELTATRKADGESGKAAHEGDEAFGWFVDTDVDGHVELLDDPYGRGKTAGLAFSFHTAPKAVTDDAQVEWAQAADTVDDVLGDLF